MIEKVYSKQQALPTNREGSLCQAPTHQIPSLIRLQREKKEKARARTKSWVRKKNQKEKTKGGTFTPRAFAPSACSACTSGIGSYDVFRRASCDARRSDNSHEVSEWRNEREKRIEREKERKKLPLLTSQIRPSSAIFFRKTGRSFEGEREIHS